MYCGNNADHPDLLSGNKVIGNRYGWGGTRCIFSCSVIFSKLCIIFKKNK